MARYATVDEYLATLSPEFAALGAELRALVRKAVPDASEAIKWAHPTYENVGPFCYFKAFSSYVNLGFWRGAALDDPHGLVISGGEKMGHIRVASRADIRRKPFTDLVKQAAALNLELGDPNRRQ